jgi:hypothetical protein
MTIYELKQRNIANGGCFFNRENLKANNETLKGFRVNRDVDPEQVVVTRRRDGYAWRFHRITGRMIAPLRTGGKVVPQVTHFTQVTHVEGDAVVDSKGNVWHAA